MLQAGAVKNEPVTVADRGVEKLMPEIVLPAAAMVSGVPSQ